jgi:hypothetical protein
VVVPVGTSTVVPTAHGGNGAGKPQAAFTSAMIGGVNGVAAGPYCSMVLA